jgi:hypothetical protein
MWEQQLVYMLEFVSEQKQVWMLKLSCRKYVEIAAQVWGQVSPQFESPEGSKSTFYKTNSYKSGSGVLTFVRNMFQASGNCIVMTGSSERTTSLCPLLT